ncbi:MADS-box transcription factor 23-like [Triticum aestivum]|uniref:MADS-box transcription factor 23-like n=1 Tax=Triticum aestivum TaxID=4565 RepID=UPI001D020D68|nr:MADS-box transcription factor 23-like [Triticum aestivum]
MVRGKAVIEKIENQTSRQVTFSKRKSRLFKKGKELGVLCDAQVGIFIFSNTGRLYEYSNSGMKPLIERYQAVKDGQKLLSASAEAKFWQAESARLEQQLRTLQENHRQLLGQHLSGLSFEDLKHLQNHLETSLYNIQLTKDKFIGDEMQELNMNESLMRQENIELHRKLNIVHQENTELQNKLTFKARKEFFPAEMLNDQGAVNMGITSPFTKCNITAPTDKNSVRLDSCHADWDDEPESSTFW